MSKMIFEVDDALREAGASEEKARKAAEALAGYENRFTQLDRALDALDRKLEQRFARVDERFAKTDGEMALLRWMIAFNLALTVAILWKVFST
jgi:hypothetical protein